MILGAKTLDCPCCGALSYMSWYELAGKAGSGSYSTFAEEYFLSSGPCCNQLSIWRYTGQGGAEIYVRLIYPLAVAAPPPHPDMPDEIARDFEEARQISGQSPRAAAALLRLCVQKICNHLLCKGGGIDEQIRELVAQGLPRKVQQSLDAVRVIGNESVHPGTMDLNDTPQVTLALFRLVNLIVQDCISAPKEADEVYALLPAGKIAGIERRDAKGKV